MLQDTALESDHFSLHTLFVTNRPFRCLDFNGNENLIIKGQLNPPVGDVTFFNHGGRLGPPVRDVTLFFWEIGQIPPLMTKSVCNKKSSLSQVVSWRSVFSGSRWVFMAVLDLFV